MSAAAKFNGASGRVVMTIDAPSGAALVACVERVMKLLTDDSAPVSGKFADGSSFEIDGLVVGVAAGKRPAQAPSANGASTPERPRRKHAVSSWPAFWAQHPGKVFMVAAVVKATKCTAQAATRAMSVAVETGLAERLGRGTIRVLGEKPQANGATS